MSLDIFTAVDHPVNGWQPPALHKRKERSDVHPFQDRQTTTIMDPATGEPITVRVDAIENGQATITVVAPPGTSVTNVREPEPPTTLH